jgi:hypothetical protein
MILPANDDLANRELSIEELDAIAAGSFWGWISHGLATVVHWIEHPPTKVDFPRPPSPGPIDALHNRL